MSIVESAGLNRAQEQAVEAFKERDVALVASAGTGKTYALVGCYLALLEENAVTQPHEIIAITFTRKAAREMRSRIRQRIARYLQEEDVNAGPEDRDRWAAHYHRLETARIGTIHSLCSEIIRAHIHLAVVDPLFDVLDEGEAARAQAVAVSRTMEWAVEAGEPVRDLLAWTGADALRDWLLAMLQRRLDVEPALEQQRWESWQNVLDARVQQLKDFAFDAEVVSGFDYLQELVERGAPAQVRRTTEPDVDALVAQIPAAVGAWRRLQAAAATEDWGAVSRFLLPLRLQLKSSGRKASWSVFDPNPKDVITALRQTYDQPFADWTGTSASAKGADLDVDLKLLAAMPHLRRLYEKAHAFYDGFKAERRALDFDDLEQTALNLLEREGCEAWLDGVGALLVDEYQDTNERQQRLVEKMAEACGRLFVVGDAKQSIYRFRGADVAVFRQQQQAIADRGGARVPLQRSYRAREELVTLLNRHVGGVLARHEQYRSAEDDLEAAYDPQAERRQGHPEPLLSDPFLELHLTLGSKSDGALRRAAAALGQRLRQLVQDPAHDLSYGDIAVLCRASTSFGHYEAAFDAMDLPYVVGAGRGFYERPEVRDLLNALQALADPHDDLALVGLLRSPVFGFTDHELYILSRQPGRSWMEKLEQLEGQRAAGTLETIRRLRRHTARIPAGAALRAFLDETGYRAALYLAGHERAVRNVDKLLATANASRQASLAAFLQVIAEVQGAIAREGEAPPVAVDAIRLMTVHAAKGLGFQVVVLGDANYSGNNAKPLLVSSRWGVVPPVQSADGARSLIYDLAFAEEREADEDELRRLLYVAATRARQKLILNGCFSKLKASGQPGYLSGWLAWLGEELGFNDTVFRIEDEERLVMPFSLPGGVEGWLYTGDFDPTGAETASAASWPDAWPAALREPLETRSPPEHGRTAWQVSAVNGGQVPARINGSLVHDALAAWRLPGDGHFEDWVRARAYHYGLVAREQQQAALARVRELLSRFTALPLYAQLQDTVRHHELPYYKEEQVIIDEFPESDSPRTRYIDLLYRAGDDRWAILDFKTDHFGDHLDTPGLLQWAAEKEYDAQVASYARAVRHLLNLTYTPHAFLCLLDCMDPHGQRVARVIEIEVSSEDI